MAESIASFTVEDKQLQGLCSNEVFLRGVPTCQFFDGLCQHFCAIITPLEAVKDVQEVIVHLSVGRHILQERGHPPVVIDRRHQLCGDLYSRALKETAHLASAVTIDLVQRNLQNRVEMPAETPRQVLKGTARAQEDSP